MHQFITISTENYLKYTFILYNSLIKTNPKAYLKIFCDCKIFNKFFKDKPRCEAIVLPEIKSLGVARARFHIYYKSCKKPFVYLDSDMIVLEDLSELFEYDSIAACLDDLSLCTFIPDKAHPWKNAPELVNKVYITSGVFFAPAKYSNFFHIMYKASLDDAYWNKYSDPLLPHDNFMNAYINIEKIMIKGLDGYKYNWQGLISDSGYTVKLAKNKLINTKTNQPLSLVHLIGKIPPDAHIRQMPEDIGVFLLKMGLPGKSKKDDVIDRTYSDILNMYFSSITKESVDEEKFFPADDFFNVVINPFPASITAKPNENLKVKVEITNKSKYSYTSESLYPVNISYHIYDQNKQTVIFDGLRTRLPAVLEPNQSSIVDIHVLTPEYRGTYILECDLVKEGVAWFKQKNERPYKIIILNVT